LEKFRNEKAKIERENKKILNIKDIDVVSNKNPPRILNEILSPKSRPNLSKNLFNYKDTINIKSLDKVI